MLCYSVFKVLCVIKIFFVKVGIFGKYYIVRWKELFVVVKFIEVVEIYFVVFVFIFVLV